MATKGVVIKTKFLAVSAFWVHSTLYSQFVLLKHDSNTNNSKAQILFPTQRVFIQENDLCPPIANLFDSSQM